MSDSTTTTPRERITTTNSDIITIIIIQKGTATTTKAAAEAGSSSIHYSGSDVLCGNRIIHTHKLSDRISLIKRHTNTRTHTKSKLYTLVLCLLDGLAL